MRYSLKVLVLAGSIVAQVVSGQSPAELLSYQFKNAQENPGAEVLKLGKLWDCYFINVDDNRSYSSSYKFTNFNGIIRGTYSFTKEHAYFYTDQGLMAQLNRFIRSYLRMAVDSSEDPTTL